MSGFLDERRGGGRIARPAASAALCLAALLGGCASDGGAEAVVRPAPEAMRVDQPPMPMTVDEIRERSGRKRGAGSIVDTNSVLSIDFNREGIRAAIEKSGFRTPRIAATIEQFKRLHAAAVAGTTELARLRGLARTADGAFDAEKFRAQLGRVANASLPALEVFTALELPEAGELDARLEERLSVDEQYALLFVYAEKAAARLEREADVALGESGVYLQFGAWLSSSSGLTPLHVPGFDDYPEEQYVRVPRFALAVGKDDVDRLEAQRKELAASGADRKQVIGQLLHDEFEPAVAAALEALRAEYAADLDAIDALKREASAASERFAARLARLRELVDRGRALVESAVANARRIPRDDAFVLLGALLSEWAPLLRQVESLGRELTAELSQLAADVEAARKFAALAGIDAIEQLQARFRSGAALGRLADLLAKSLQHLPGFQVVAKVDAAALAFGEEVTKFDVAGFPEHAQFDIHRASKRERGDNIVLQLGAGRRADPKDDKVLARDMVPLARFEAGLYQLDSYIRATAGLVFANPSGRSNLDSEFDTGVAYHFLLKDDSDAEARIDASFWNDILDPGIGLSIAALDLNGDSTREIGLAGTVSLFRDFLQVGYGYDLQEGEGFFMLGLRLPLTGTTIPLAPNSGTGE